MPGQARLLVQRMKEDTEIDMDNDWKIITVFIGGNDLCDYCGDPVSKDYIYVKLNGFTIGCLNSIGLISLLLLR